MASAPQAPGPGLSPGDMQILIARAGLTLNPGQMADLVLAWRQVSGLIAALPVDRPFADDMATVFRLPPPVRPTPPVKPRATRPRATAKSPGRP